MSTEPGGEATVVETTEAAHEAAVSSQETATETDFEAEARKMGWVPEEEFKGDKKPAKFLSAEEYYRRGEEIIPLIRSQKKHLEKEVEELRETNKRMSAMFEKTLQRERDNAKQEIENLKAERKEALKAGDDAKADQIDQQIDTLKEEVKTDKASAKSYDDYADDYQPVEDSPEHTALTQAFVKAHAWMIDEPEMGEYAEKWSKRNADANPSIGFKANAKATEAAVRRKFPGYFAGEKETTPAANGHAAVDTGGAFTGAPQAKGPASKLNATELAQARKDVAAKLYKNIDEWAIAYNS